jgi:hypothetical protein
MLDMMRRDYEDHFDSNTLSDFRIFILCMYGRMNETSAHDPH